MTTVESYLNVKVLYYDYFNYCSLYLIVMIIKDDNGEIKNLVESEVCAV